MSDGLEQVLSLGNEGAPKEWLEAQTGLGIPEFEMEGVPAEVAVSILQSDPIPLLPIEADPEVRSYLCNRANYTVGRQGCAIDYIVVHYTGGAMTDEGAAYANCVYFGRESVGASAHYFIDSGYTIWQSVPDGDTAWHAGNWNMNLRAIGIEVCSAGAFTSKEIERLTWLVGQLMRKYGIPASRVIRHYDVTGKHCPAYYVDAARWAALHAVITGRSDMDEIKKLCKEIKSYLMDTTDYSGRGKKSNFITRLCWMAAKQEHMQDSIDALTRKCNSMDKKLDAIVKKIGA